MAKGFVIVHNAMGIYLGNCLGMGFFSELDCAGQETAAMFDTELECKQHIESWDDNNDPTEYSFHPVETAGTFHVTIEELDKAGLRTWLEPMLLERHTNYLAAATPAGRA